MGYGKAANIYSEQNIKKPNYKAVSQSFKLSRKYVPYLIYFSPSAVSGKNLKVKSLITMNCISCLYTLIT